MRKVKINRYGNIVGYLGTKRTVEFGDDAVTAGYWLVHGVVDWYAGHSDSAKYTAAIL